MLKRRMKYVCSLAARLAVSLAAASFPAVLYAQAADATEVAPSAFSGIDESVAQLSKITGLKALKKVQFDSITKAGFKEFVNATIQEHIKPEELQAQELALKMLGLVPRDFNLMTSTVDLLTEQAAAFYDYRKKKLFLMEGGDPATQPVLVVHELAHALADQHFDLGKFMKKGQNDDASLARMAVMEGQATWLMMEAMAQRIGASLRTMPGMADAMSGTTEQMTNEYPVLKSAPLYIRASLLFPYKEGFRFQHALVQKLGEAAFTKVFREAPVSSQQVLHPDLYLTGVRPTVPALPELANAASYRELIAGTMGEFDHAILLEQYVGKPEADALSPDWRGGTLGLMKHRDDHVVMLYSSDWKDEASATRMFNAYKQVLRKKASGKVQFESDGAKQATGTSDGQAFHVALDGTRLVAVEGMKSIAEVKNLSPAR